MKASLKLGEKIRIVRKMTDLSQLNLANELGITQQAYQKLEQGKTIMTETRLTEIAKILDVTEQEIREIDQVPIINKNIKHCRQFGNFKPVYYNESSKETKKEVEDIAKENEIMEMRREVRDLKYMFEEFINKFGRNGTSEGYIAK